MIHVLPPSTEIPPTKPLSIQEENAPDLYVKLVNFCLFSIYRIFSSPFLFSASFLLPICSSQIISNKFHCECCAPKKLRPTKRKCQTKWITMALPNDFVCISVVYFVVFSLFGWCLFVCVAIATGWVHRNGRDREEMEGYAHLIWICNTILGWKQISTFFPSG